MVLCNLTPHVDFEVNDLSAESAGKEILIASNSPSPGRFQLDKK